MLNCIYNKFQGGYENGYVLSDGETLMTVQHLASETHTQVIVCFNCEDSITREFLISHLVQDDDWAIWIDELNQQLHLDAYRLQAV